MANAMFLNAMPFRIAVNLNSELDNHHLDPIEVAEGGAELKSWPAPIDSFPARGVFGGDDETNYLVVLSEGSPQPTVWEIRSTVSITLDLYLYVMDARVAGVSQTGSSEGIVVQPASPEIAASLLRRVPAARF
ncbi:MAG: hypothetical protein PVG07_03220 [Acidobacteriota bacterium]|jgi:hypothetical protein